MMGQNELESKERVNGINCSFVSPIQEDNLARIYARDQKLCVISDSVETFNHKFMSKKS